MFTISNCNLIKKDIIESGVNIVIDNGKIIDINKKTVENFDYDASGKFVSAGLIDMHTHGGYGGDFMDADKTAFDNVLKFHLDNGTTSVVATSVTAPKKCILKFLNYYREYQKNDMPYAELIGVHLEGPYLSVRNKGAQKEEYLLLPNKDDYSFITDNADIIKTVTISPELDTDGKMTSVLTKNGIVVCGGHDDGIYPEFMPAINNGLKHLTHAFCAMSEVRFKDGKRNVGLREYGLIDDRLTAEIIYDRRHITKELALMIIKAKGIDNVCCVSDSLRCAGNKIDGKLYKLGSDDDENVTLFKVSDGVAVISDGSRYAGSITPVLTMVKYLIEDGFSICDAFKTATVNPARILNMKDIGSIEIGKTADLCVFDKDFNLINVIKKGKIKK